MIFCVRGGTEFLGAFSCTTRGARSSISILQIIVGTRKISMMQINFQEDC